MRRREFITLLGSMGQAPFAARAEQTMPVIGVRGSRFAHDYLPGLTLFKNARSMPG